MALGFVKLLRVAKGWTYGVLGSGHSGKVAVLHQVNVSIAL